MLHLVTIHLSYNSAVEDVLISWILSVITHTGDVSCYPKALIKWKQFFFIPSTEKIWSTTKTCLLTNKTKEIYFKILHRYYPCDTFINKIRKDVSTKCSFCHLENKTLTHLFCGFGSRYLCWFLIYLIK